MNYSMTFYYGLRSPYAWIARRILVDALTPEELGRIEMVPYWDPAPETEAALQAAGGKFLYRPMSKQRHLYILQDVTRLAANCQYQIKWPQDPPGACWEPPHLACLAAARSGCGAEAIDRLFAFRWQEGHDICSASVLGELLRSADLPEPGGLAPSDKRALAEEAVSIQLRCYRAGVFGLPYFRVGRESFWGMDRLPAAMRRADLPIEAVSLSCRRALDVDDRLDTAPAHPEEAS